MDPGQWKGLFDWSMTFQDGTRPADYNSVQLSEEKRKWLEEALKAHVKDFVDRMKEIKQSLDDGDEKPVTLEEKEALLDELMDIVDNIDYARDLQTLGGMVTVIELLRSPAPSLRWRSAEVTATCVANNPPLQQEFLAAGVLPPLIDMMADDNPTCRSKALLALSALVRQCPEALEAFQSAGGLSKLHTMLHEEKEDKRIRRKALFFLGFLCSEKSHDGDKPVDPQLIPTVVSCLEDEETSVRQGSLSVLIAMGKDTEARQRIKEDKRLADLIPSLLKRYYSIAEELREAEQEEGELLKELRSLMDSKNVIDKETPLQSKSPDLPLIEIPDKPDQPD